jgi:hypothetical protein
VDKVALGRVFSECFGFPSQCSFHRLLHYHQRSSGAGTIGQQWPTYQVDSVSPHPEKLIKKTPFGFTESFGRFPNNLTCSNHCRFKPAAPHTGSVCGPWRQKRYQTEIRVFSQTVLDSQIRNGPIKSQIYCDAGDITTAMHYFLKLNPHPLKGSRPETYDVRII